VARGHILGFSIGVPQCECVIMVFDPVPKRMIQVRVYTVSKNVYILFFE